MDLCVRHIYRFVVTSHGITVRMKLQMEKNAAAGRTPSSVPMPTPPPSSLNLSSPKFGPLSPVNTNPLNDAKSVNNKIEPSHFSLPPSYGEDDRGGNALPSRGLSSEHLELQRNDRLPSGGTHVPGYFYFSLCVFLSFFIFDILTVHFKRQLQNSFFDAVTSGTLEAIRERMKSISLATTVGNADPSNRPLMSMNGNISHVVSNHGPGTEHSSVENTIQSGVLPMDEKALSGLQARMERLKSGSMEF